MSCSIRAVAVVLAAGQFVWAADKSEKGIDLFDGKR